jgi:hypothetical protein
VRNIKKVFLALVITPLLLTFPTIPSFAATNSVEVNIEVVEPYTPIGSDTLRLSGSLKNTTATNLTGLSLRLILSDPITSRSALNQILSSPNPVELIPRGQVYRTNDLRPGSYGAFSIGIQTAQLLAKGPGVYLVGYQIINDAGILGSGFTVIPFLNDRTSVRPIGLTLLWPVTAPPLRNGDGILLDETIPKSMASTGRLRNILNAGKSTNVTWLLDPDLLDLAEKASKGYLVSTSTENVNGSFQNEVATWFNELRTTVAGSERFSLTYANADLASMQRSRATSAFEQSVTIAKVITENKLSFVTAGTVLMQDRFAINEATIGKANSLGTNIVVLPDTALPPIVGTTFTPSGTTTLETPNGRVKIFLTDSVISNMSNNKVENAVQTSLQRQKLLSETLLLALQLPNVDRNIFVSPPMYWEPTNEGAAVFAEGLMRAPWVIKNDAAQVLIKDVSTVQRDNFLNTLQAENSELSNDQMSRIKKAQSLLAQLTGLFQQPGVVSSDYAAAILRAGSQYWQNSPSQARDFINNINNVLQSSRDKVRILAGNSVVLPGDKGPIPITIANEFSEPVIVSLTATSIPAFRFQSDLLDPITVAPNSKQSLSFTGTVQGAGAVDVTLQLYTRDGFKYGEPKIISVRSAAYSAVATWVTGFAFLALILLSSLSIFRRVRSSRKNKS